MLLSNNIIMSTVERFPYLNLNIHYMAKGMRTPDIHAHMLTEHPGNLHSFGRVFH